MDKERDSERGKGKERRSIPASERERAAEEAFVRGVIERGEAAKPDRDGRLPLGRPTRSSRK